MITMTQEIGVPVRRSTAGRRRGRLGLLSICANASRILLGVIFLVSSLAKIRHPYMFLSQVFTFELTGPVLSEIVAGLLPWLELVLGLCLLANVLPLGGLLLSVLLSVLFVSVQASVIHRGLGISCGCFGSLTKSETITYTTLIRSGAMLLIAVAGYFSALRLRRSQPQVEPEVDAAGCDLPPSTRRPAQPALEPVGRMLTVRSTV